MNRQLSHYLGMLMLVCPLSLFASTNSRLENLERVTNAQNRSLLELRNELTTAYKEIDELRGQLEQVNQRINAFEKQRAQTQSSSDVDATLAATNDAGNAAISNKDEKQVYDDIVTMILSGARDDDAQAALERYLVDYPNSRYTDNALYWLGQIHFTKNDNDQAINFFSDVVRKYPKSLKAAESMYKVGLLLERKGDSNKAKSVYQQVIKQYPDSTFSTEAKQRFSK